MKRSPSAVVPFATLLGLLVAGGRSFAQGAAAEPATTAPTAPLVAVPAAAPSHVSALVPTDSDDVIRLRDGSMIRGRLAERRADGTTVMVLLSGEIRTIPGTDIASVGHPQTSTAPVQVPVAPARDDDWPMTRSPRPGRVPVMFVSSTSTRISVGIPTESVSVSRGLVWSAREELFEPVCSTPCTVWVRPGRLHFASSNGSGGGGTGHDLEVPQTGVRVVLRRSGGLGDFAETSLQALGTAALGTGVVLAILASSYLTFDRSAGLGYAAGATIAILGGLAGIAGASVSSALGTASIRRRTPLEARDQRSRRPLAQRWSGGIAPVAGGVFIGAVVSF